MANAKNEYLVKLVRATASQRYSEFMKNVSLEHLANEYASYKKTPSLRLYAQTLNEEYQRCVDSLAKDPNNERLVF